MFQDEAGFGRINKPKYCWCKKGIRPSVPCHHIREYRYVYGAVEPATGENYFWIMPYCNTEYMNAFLRNLSKDFSDDEIVLVCDGAAWHKSNSPGLKNKPCKRNNRQNSDNTKNAAKQGNAEERPDAGCGIKR